MNANDRLVKGPEGVYGTVDITCWPNLDEKSEPEVDMRLPDGSHITVPADALIEQKDGSFYLPWHRHELTSTPDQRGPQQSATGKWPCAQTM